MRVAIVPEPGRIELVYAPVPTPSEYEALVEIPTWSICSGTDTHIVHDQFPMRVYPCVLGHESIGRDIECGAAMRNLKPGGSGVAAHCGATRGNIGRLQFDVWWFCGIWDRGRCRGDYCGYTTR